MKFKKPRLKDLKKLLSEPETLSPYVEELSPWLNRQFLSYVSELSSPYKIGMGLSIRALDDERVEVQLPARLRMQDQQNVIHTGVLIALAEQTAQLFWQRHLDQRSSQMRLVHIEAELLVPAQGDLKARLQMPEAERERLLFEMRLQGSIEPVLTVRIFNKSDQQVAVLQTRWLISHQPALESGQR